MPLVTPRGDRSRRGPAPEMAHTRLSARVKVLRRPIRYLRVPGQTFQATLMQHGMSRVWAERLAGRMAQVDQGLYNAPPPPASASGARTCSSQPSSPERRCGGT